MIFALFLFWESRYRHAMLDLSLFKVRNFAITNIETLVVYAGLIGAFFFITLFLQQTAGYSPIGAGLATTPVSLVMFVLSPRFGKMSTGIGPRVPMSIGPIVGGIGLLLLMRVGSDPNYLTEVLPAILVFGLGLSATVAPLTATALNSVEERHVGIASGINNGVSRVAGLLAIAILGALIAGKFTSTIDANLAGKQLSPQARASGRARPRTSHSAPPTRPTSRPSRPPRSTTPSPMPPRSPSISGVGGRRHPDDRRRRDRRDRPAQSEPRDRVRGTGSRDGRRVRPLPGAPRRGHGG